MSTYLCVIMATRLGCTVMRRTLDLADREGFAWATGARSVPAASRADALAQAGVLSPAAPLPEDNAAAPDRTDESTGAGGAAKIVVGPFIAGAMGL
jgi:hypothetical protein